MIIHMNIHCLYEHFHDYTCEHLNEPDEHFHDYTCEDINEPDEHFMNIHMNIYRVSQKNETPCLLNILAIKYLIFKCFFFF